MLFNSFAFLIFLPIVVIVYWLLPHKFRWIILLIASYYFYMSWNANLVILIGGTTLMSYSIGLIIEKSKKQSIRKTALIINIITALGVLFFFKYFNFFSVSVTNFLKLIGLPANKFTLNLLLPVGVSFYTFQTLSYTIDIYKGKIKAERHLGYYALFVVFFPQLVAGPIERPSDLLPQLKLKSKFDIDNFKSGLGFLVAGFFKKLVIADFLAIFVKSVFDNPASKAGGLSTLIATLLFAVQILCDFDGYTNIAIGASKLMNINLTKNFDNPYGATSIKQFWSRWHITLSAWFKDYLYIPLGGNRVKKPRWCFNVFFVFLISGLWHGANFTFVIWGALHGIYQIAEHFAAKPANKVYSKLKINTKGKGFKFFCVARTFVLVCIAWIFFRANSAGEAFLFIGRLFSRWSLKPSYFSSEFAKLGMDTSSLLICVLGILTLYLFSSSKRPIFQIPSSSGIGSIAAKTNFSRVVLNILMITAIVFAWVYVLYLSGGENGFIYFQF